MNNVILSGRLTRDPEVRHSQNGNEDRIVARYTLAVDRVYSKENQQADFINCVELSSLNLMSLRRVRELLNRTVMHQSAEMCRLLALMDS